VKSASIIGAGIFLLCLLTLPVLAYLSGRKCRHLSVAIVLPAEVVPWLVGAVAAVTVFGMTVASLVVRHERLWTLGALGIVVVSTAVFWFCFQPVTVFLYGLRDCFAARVGYPTLRQFAREILQDGSPIEADGALYPPGVRGHASPDEQKRWEDLVARYPFLGWNGGSATFARRGSVRLHWGSALVGHWGFEVVVEGSLHISEDDRERAFKVADDLQFFWDD